MALIVMDRYRKAIPRQKYFTYWQDKPHNAKNHALNSEQPTLLPWERVSIFSQWQATTTGLSLLHGIHLHQGKTKQKVFSPSAPSTQGWQLCKWVTLLTRGQQETKHNRWKSRNSQNRGRKLQPVKSSSAQVIYLEKYNYFWRCWGSQINWKCICKWKSVIFLQSRMTFHTSTNPLCTVPSASSSHQAKKQDTLWAASLSWVKGNWQKFFYLQQPGVQEKAFFSTAVAPSESDSEDHICLGYKKLTLTP